ncbi:MAG: Bifunctional PGK/TIM [Elusimicrobia bacterium]|nr:Bifunctional PGK/TIM [Elusimicrobiota bacterium]
MSQNTRSQRRPLIAANWKMYKTHVEAETFIKNFLPLVSGNREIDVVICPPFTALSHVAALTRGSNVSLGAQNLNENLEGAFTGEISPGMLGAMGCTHVIIGHSERRQIFGETDAAVNKKIITALKNNLIPIVCVGETLAERESNATLSVVSRQVKAAFADIPSADMKKIVLAYEPIWAIGTGRTATPAQAQEVHLAIRDILKDQYGSLTSLAIRILYGGSVKPDNMADLMACEDVDGGLVGGASLKPDSFAAIVNYQNQNVSSR